MIRLVKNIWMILTLDCEGSASLTSESFDRKLTWAEILAVKLHCMICAKSRKLGRQMTAMNKKLDALMESHEPSFGLSDDARQRIADKLAQAQDE